MRYLLWSLRWCFYLVSAAIVVFTASVLFGRPHKGPFTEAERKQILEDGRHYDDVKKY